MLTMQKTVKTEMAVGYLKGYKCPMSYLSYQIYMPITFVYLHRANDMNMFGF